MDLRLMHIKILSTEFARSRSIFKFQRVEEISTPLLRKIATSMLISFYFFVIECRMFMYILSDRTKNLWRME